jgi:tetratricopeptide (TPR) repeat protein
MSNVKEILEKVALLRKERKIDDALDMINKCDEKSLDVEIVRAELYAEKGDYRNAVSILDGAISKYGPNKQLYMKRSVFRFKLDDRKGALEDIMSAHEIDPNDINVRKGLIDVNASLGNYEEALRILENTNFNGIDTGMLERKKNLLRLIQLKKEVDKYNFMLDCVRASIKDEHLLIAKELFEAIDERRDAEYYETGCVLYRKLGMPYRVIELAEEAISKKKTNEKLLRTLAFAYMDIHKFNEAVHVFEELLKTRKDDPNLHADMALGYLNIGELKKALKHIDTAIKIDPYRDTYYIRKGDITARIEGLESALKMYEKAISLNPMSEEAIERKETVLSILYGKASERDKGLFR